MMRRTNDGTYLFDSATTPGKVYTVEYVETRHDWILVCNCKAAEFSRDCWHRRAAADAEAARPRRRAA